MSNPLGCSLKYSQSYFRFKIFAVNEPLIDVSPLVTSMSPEISSAEAEVTFTSPVRELPKIEQGLLTGKHRQSQCAFKRGANKHVVTTTTRSTERIST